MASRQDYDDEPGRALAQAVVAMVAVALLVGVSLGLALMAGAKIGGLGSGSGGGDTAAADAGDDSTEGLYMPPYQPTEDSGDEWNLPDPSETPPSLGGEGGDQESGDEEPKRQEITLFVAPQQVGPGERINFNGVYEGADGATLQVQRREGGSWGDFPVTASVRGGSFETWIQTSRTGRSKFRMYDESADKASNVVTVQIG